MKNPIVLSVLHYFIFFVSSAQLEQAEVNFEISNMKFRKVHGSFSGMKGVLQIDPNDLSASKIATCIDAHSVNTNNEKRDKHLRNTDFFDTDRFPTICFKSTVITTTKDGYLAKGELTLHGVTKSIEVPFTLSDHHFKGEINLNRLDFDLGKKTNSFMVGNKVKINISIQSI